MFTDRDRAEMQDRADEVRPIMGWSGTPWVATGKASGDAEGRIWFEYRYTGPDMNVYPYYVHGETEWRRVE